MFLPGLPAACQSLLREEHQVACGGWRFFPASGSSTGEVCGAKAQINQNESTPRWHKPKMHQKAQTKNASTFTWLPRAPSILHANPAPVKLGRATGRILPSGELLDDLHRDPHASLCPREIQVAVTSSASQSVWLGGSELEPSSFPFTLGKKTSGDFPKPIQST